MTLQQYDFDELINRQETNAMAVDGFRDYLFKGQKNLNFPVPDHELIPLWVAAIVSTLTISQRNALTLK